MVKNPQISTNTTLYESLIIIISLLVIIGYLVLSVAMGLDRCLYAVVKQPIDLHQRLCRLKTYQIIE
ncbi:hypothetical protein [Crenothrix sp.]|uniref:hypothetical protein n=1 Tax=Crenothrix sp. TaxID=3100433 RepID=UPI00374D69D1